MPEEKTVCIACGCQCKSHPPIFTSHENNFEIVSKDVENLEVIIHHFRTVKSHRLRILNAISASTRNIPNEIFIQIFQSVCSAAKTGPDPNGCPQITLAAVSSHWRDVVRGAPELWKTFSVKLSEENLQNTLPLLQTYLDNNGAFFNAVRLDFETNTEYGAREHQAQCLRDILLLRERGNVRAIDLRSPPDDWLPVILACPSIEDLRVSQSPSPYLWGSGIARELIDQLSWSRSSLATLHLTRVPVNICFDALLGCPNLIHFSCVEPSRATDDCPRPNQHHVRVKVFSRLESLSWYSANQHLWNDNLLQHYSFPAVRHLAWTILPGKYDWPSFHRFVSSLELNLRSLVLSTSPEIVKVARWFNTRWLNSPYVDHLTFSDFPSSSLST